MANYPYQKSYAKYLLRKNNFLISYHGKKYFTTLPKDSLLPEFFFSEYQQPKIKMGTIPKGEYIKIIKNYDILKDMGYYVVKLVANPKSKRFYQRNEYKLVKKEVMDDTVMHNFPRGRYVEFDVTNDRIRLLGDGADSSWKFLKQKHLRYEDEDLKIDIKVKNLWGIPQTIDDNANKTIKISEKHLPIGISPEYKLICIPFMPDAHVFGFVGYRGTSKSISMHSLLSLLYWQWGVSCCWLNDWNDECGTWTLPTNGSEFKDRLNQSGLTPQPLPCIFLKPHVKGSKKEDLLLYKEGLSAYISIDWRQFIRRYNDYTQGYKILELGKSGRNINKEAIANCRNFGEIEEYLERNLPGKSNAPSRDKLLNIFKTFYDNQITNISTSAPAKFKVERKNLKEEKMLNPIMGGIYAGLVPIFSPRDLETVQVEGTSKRANAISLYINYLVSNIYETKVKEEYFKNKYLYIFVDELGAMIQGGGIKPFAEILSRGRMKGVGVAWANQMFTTIPKEIRTNTEYLFCMGYDDNPQISAIASDFNCPKDVRDELHTLGKKTKHEAYVFHKKPLISYDLDSGEVETISDRPIRIQFLPPLSEHQKPMGVI